MSNTPDVLSDTVADTALGLILMTLRRFGAADRYVRAGRWAADGAFPYARDVSGLQVGILGFGTDRPGDRDAAARIRLCHRLSQPPPDAGLAVSVRRIALRTRRVGRHLVVATAGGGGTEKLVSREVLQALGPQGYLINIARGSVVDQDALVELLASGGLAGAGLDVYVDEPNVPAELRELDNVVLLPHVGSATARTRAAMAQLTLRNLESYLSAKKLVTPVLQPSR